jgi:nucleoside-diphosphate-sugar epimerase
VRPAARLFYAQEKAQLEHLLRQEAAEHPGVELYVLRPPIVLGPNFLGAKELLPRPFAPLGRWLAKRMGTLPVPMPVLVPALTMQFIHEEDVGQALLLCVVGAGPPDAYNIAGDGIVTTLDIARELGAIPIPLPEAPARVIARVIATLPFLPTAAEWIEAASHPAIMDTSRARTELGWKPVYTGLEALRDTVRVRPGAVTRDRAR